MTTHADQIQPLGQKLHNIYIDGDQKVWLQNKSDNKWK